MIYKQRHSGLKQTQLFICVYLPVYAENERTRNQYCKKRKCSSRPIPVTVSKEQDLCNLEFIIHQGFKHTFLYQIEVLSINRRVCFFSFWIVK